MNLSDITTKAWILALFKRDDGERFLLGDGWYDFKDSLQHFSPNNIANDIVELQGADGQLLAGQVRRSSAQSFDGYVGDATISKADIETRRVDFLGFFQVRHKYTVIYIFPDGTAIQRQRGYLTDAPSVPEMWQKFPEYHVALNFEDVNYYEYAENAQGDEIYANSLNLTALTYLTVGGMNPTLEGISSAYPNFILYQPVGNAFQDGIPSPTSQEPIRVATGRQLITFTNGTGTSREYTLTISKNLLSSSIEQGTIASASGLNGDNNTRVRTKDYITANSKTTYTINALLKNTDAQCIVFCYSGNKTYLGRIGSEWMDMPFTFSPLANTSYIRIAFRLSTDAVVAPSDITGAQLEVGTVATGPLEYYEPIELFRQSGVAEDYIYLDGSTWRVRKEFGKITLDGSETGWNYDSTNKAFWIRNSDAGTGYSSSATGYVYKMCDRFQYFAQNGNNASLADGLYENTSTSSLSMLIFHHSASTSLSAFQSWLANNPTTIYYRRASVATPAITDTNLISQLNLLRNRALYTPNVYTSVWAPTGVAPYRQYLRTFSNSNEQTFSFNGITNISPVWTVPGPASSPKLKNASTGQELSYNSTVASGQTLVIDMANKTAMIGSTNVISYVSGDWVQIRPGENIIAFTTSDRIGTSKLEWNGVVG